MAAAGSKNTDLNMQIISAITESYLNYSGGLSLDVLQAQFLAGGAPGVLDVNLDAAADLLYQVYSDECGKHMLDDYSGTFSRNGKFARMRQLVDMGSEKAVGYLQIMEEQNNPDAE